jgi:broad specificity phosphatase PhoE
VNKYLILVKHSLPEIVEEVPAREWHLSNQGLVRAKQLADRLIAYQPEILISSVEPKARETAEIIGTLHELRVEVVEDLHEHDRSETRYLSKDEFQNAVREFFLNPDELVFGKETANEAHRRFSKAVQSILGTHGNKTVVIVAHGTVISLFVARLTDTSEYSLWNQLGLPGFIVLDITSNKLIAQENIL